MICKQVTTTWQAHEEHRGDLADKATFKQTDLTEEACDRLKDRGKRVRA